MFLSLSVNLSVFPKDSSLGISLMLSRLTGLGMFRYRRRLAFAAYLLYSPLKDYMETKIFCCFGFAVIFSFVANQSYANRPSNEAIRLTQLYKKNVMHVKGSVLLRTGGTAQVFERQTELQSCTVPCKRIAQVENSSVQTFVRTRVNVV